MRAGKARQMPVVPVSYPFAYGLPPSLFLPGSPNNPPLAPSVEDEPGEKAEGQPRALVVDDAPDVSEMLGMMLRLSGYDVTIASSAAEALSCAHSIQFDVIVSDIGMPVMNGYELAERLRALPAYSAVPMIAVTGFSRYDDHTRALQSGFDAHLTKPIDPLLLVDLIDRLRAEG